MIDLATITVTAGHGGDGIVTFRHEKFISKGGPDGGDGGNGGSVYLIADHNLATLMDFRSKTKYKAQDGSGGMRRKKKGADGSDIYIKVPVGTLVFELSQSEELFLEDMNQNGKLYLAVEGGKGGVGNDRFKSSTNRTPLQYTKGERGQSKELKLEVKLVADVGLIGAPNAGKSTLINKLTNSLAKVSSYPFTTLSPNLGTMRLDNGRKIVISDIPGLIEGASEGKGLGDEFLRHVERTSLLVHLIDPYCEGEEDDTVFSAMSKYEMIQNELKMYKIDLTRKPQLVVINKMDITEVRESFNEIKEEFLKRFGISVMGISGVTGEGLSQLTNKITGMLSELPAEPPSKASPRLKRFTIENLPNKKIVSGRNKVHELKYSSNLKNLTGLRKREGR